MYGTWQVNQLKEELRRRGATVRGKKADLIERLQFYGKYSNFGQAETLEEEDPDVIVPATENFRDINGDTILPPLNKTQIRHYLSYTQKKFDASLELYESRHLITVRSCVAGDNTFLKGFCRKTMKNLHYEVNIKLDEFGNPLESHCECAAGSGTNATCKHVAVILLGVEQMKREKNILIDEVCTQKLQQFHVPKKRYTGTPVKAEKLASKKRKKIVFEPYPIANLDKHNYIQRVRSLILNFENSTMPLKQLYKPANPYALHSDHDYNQFHAQDKFLLDLKLYRISQKEIHEIEKATIGQSANSEWHSYRNYRMTASNFHTICHLKPTTLEKFAKQLLNKKMFSSRATTHGLVHETIAIKEYCAKYDLLVESCGLFISHERPYLAASPDGVLGEQTIIEVKCPYASRYQMISPKSVPYLIEENGILSLKSTAPYYYQIQGQLYCSNKQFCNLIIYTFRDLKLIYVNRDNTFIKNMLSKLDIFYNTYFKNELFEKYLYFDYRSMKNN